MLISKIKTAGSQKSELKRHIFNIQLTYKSLKINILQDEPIHDKFFDTVLLSMQKYKP